MTENATNFDKVNVYGGGSTGPEAVRMALARVMCEVNAENRLILKPEGLLTRDPRMVERKKFGQKKVRNFNSRNVNIACLEYIYSRLIGLLLNLKQCCCCLPR
jgi:ribosomal protein S9